MSTTARASLHAPTKTASPDLVERQFTAASPDHLWVADITQHPTDEGWLYLAVVIDIFSRKVVGWAMSERLYAELVVSALDMALKNRRPAAGLIHHSDQRAGPVEVQTEHAALPKTRRNTPLLPSGKGSSKRVSSAQWVPWVTL